MSAGWEPLLAEALAGLAEDTSDGCARAVAATDRLLAATPRGRPGQVEALGVQGLALLRLAQVDRREAILDRAIDRLAAASEQTPPDDPPAPTLAGALGQARQERYDRRGDATDLERAIAAARRGLELVPPWSRPDPAAGACLTLLCTAHLRRFERWRSTPDIEEAVRWGRAACREYARAAIAPVDLGGALGALSLALLRRYTRGVGDRDDLDEAVALGERAVALFPDGDPDRPSALSDLGAALLNRAGADQSDADAEAARTVLRQARGLLGPDDARLPRVLNNLSLAERLTWELTGDEPALQRAVGHARDAAAGLAPGHVDATAIGSTHATAIGSRHELHGALADLDAAIAVVTEGLAPLAVDDPRRGDQEMALGQLLMQRYTRTGDRADLDRAIAVRSPTGTAARPEPDPRRPVRQASLAEAHRIRAQETGERADADRAVALLEDALVDLPAGSGHRILALGALAVALLLRDELAGAAGPFGTAPADVQRAVAVAREAWAAIPERSPLVARHGAILATALEARAAATGSESDLREALAVYGPAVGNPAAPTHARVDAARRGARLAALCGEVELAALGFAGAIGLLPRLVWRSAARHDKEHRLQQYGGLGVDAAACEVAVGRAGEAVRWLEQSRAVLWSQALDLRADDQLGGLARRDRALADRLERVLAAIRAVDADAEAGQLV